MDSESDDVHRQLSDNLSLNEKQQFLHFHWSLIFLFHSHDKMIKRVSVRATRQATMMEKIDNKLCFCAMTKHRERVRDRLDSRQLQWTMKARSGTVAAACVYVSHCAVVETTKTYFQKGSDDADERHISNSKNTAAAGPMQMRTVAENCSEHTQLCPESCVVRLKSPRGH